MAQVYNPSTQGGGRGRSGAASSRLASAHNVSARLKKPRIHTRVHTRACANVGDDRETVSLWGGVALLEPSPVLHHQFSCLRRVFEEPK